MRKIIKQIFIMITIVLIQVINAYSNNEIFAEIVFGLTGITLSSFQATSILYVFEMLKEVINYLIKELNRHKDCIKQKVFNEQDLISDPQDFSSRCKTILIILNINSKLDTSNLPFDIQMFAILILAVIYKWYYRK